jgi:hypothetical protein
METTLQEIYANYLKEEGFPATKIVEEGNVFFKAEGQVYFIRTNADCPERFALVLPTFWEIEDEAEAYRALTVCNEVHLRVHGVTLFCVHNAVSATVELFLADPAEDIKNVFYPALKALQRAVYWFVTLMYKAEPPDSPSGGGAGVPAHTSNGVENTGVYL